MVDAGEPHHPPTDAVGEDELLEEARWQLTLLQRRIQVEEALERVRARAMAMRTSDELTRVAEVCFAQFIGLEIPSLRRFMILVIDPDEDTASFWASSESDQPGTHRVTVPMRENATFREITERWLAHEDRFSVFVEGQAMEDFVTHVVKYGWRYPAGERPTDRVVLNYASYSHGLMQAMTYESVADEDFDILARFAKVFEQTYTRFLDLKKAEEQAREAQIEAALERVRARSMAMHKSDELAEAAELLYRELMALGINPWASGYVFLDEETGQGSVWAFQQDGPILGELWSVPSTEDPVLRDRYASWKRQELLP